jgi:hypothetical protein
MDYYYKHVFKLSELSRKLSRDIFLGISSNCENICWILLNCRSFSYQLLQLHQRYSLTEGCFMLFNILLILCIRYVIDTAVQKLVLPTSTFFVIVQYTVQYIYSRVPVLLYFSLIKVYMIVDRFAIKTVVLRNRNKAHNFLCWSRIGLKIYNF